MRRPRKIAMAAILLLSLAMLTVRTSRMWGPLPRTPGAETLKPPESMAAEPARFRTVKVVEVVDGDTIVIDGGVHVRYIGIDTPEKGEPFFIEARRENRRLLASGDVSIQGCPERPLDKYGRTRAFVRAGGKLVNAELVGRGLARTLFMSGCVDGVAADFVLREIEAWRDRIGTWSGADLEPIDHTETGAHIGALRAVTGRVLEVSQGRQATFINFSEDYRNDFTAVVFPRGMARFRALGLDPASAYTGRRVRVTGRIGLHNGPQVIIETPEQISFTVDH